MEKDLDLNQIREIIRQNHGELIYGDKGEDTETKNVYKIKIANSNDDVFELKVEVEKYVNIELWGIDINSTNEYGLPQIFAHFTKFDDLKSTLISLEII